MNISIVAFYTGLCALLVLGLAARVIVLRFRHGVGIGDGGEAELARAIRVHANAVEYVPLALVLLLLLALEGTRPALLHAFGSVLVVARLLHAFGLSRASGTSFGRASGAGLTVLLMLVMAVMLVVRFVR